MENEKAMLIDPDAVIERLAERRLSIHVSQALTYSPYAFTRPDDEGEYVRFEDAREEILRGLKSAASPPACAPAVFGPYGWLLMPCRLAEDSWVLAAEPSRDTEEVRSVALYTLEDLPLSAAQKEADHE